MRPSFFHLKMKTARICALLAAAAFLSCALAGSRTEVLAGTIQSGDSSADQPVDSSADRSAGSSANTSAEEPADASSHTQALPAGWELTPAGALTIPLDPTLGEGLVRLRCPDGTDVPYPFHTEDTSLRMALTGGSGSYRVDILKKTEKTGKYAFAASQSLEASLADPDAVFTADDHFVHFEENGEVADKAAAFYKEASSDADFVNRVYLWMIDSYSYDEYAAVETRADYVPDPERAVGESAGTALDLASLMTAMLRSQGIPARLCLGYTGDTFHAWVSVRTESGGGIGGVAEARAGSWTLLDPAVGCANPAADVKKYIGNPGNYLLLYCY